MGKTGIEPVRVLPRRILSPVRLPVPPLSHASYILTFFFSSVKKILKIFSLKYNFSLKTIYCNRNKEEYYAKVKEDVGNNCNGDSFV